MVALGGGRLPQPPNFFLSEVRVPVPLAKAFSLEMSRFIIRILASPGLIAIRQRVPLAWRQRLREHLERPVRRDLRFRRTSEWCVAQPAMVPPKDEVGLMPSAGIAGGINIYGYFSRWLGLGECARLYARALLNSGYRVSLHDVDIDIPHARHDHTLDRLMDPNPSFDWSLIFVNPDHWAEALRMLPESASSNHVVGYWFWELEQFPHDWLTALDHVDEIMVSSAFVEETVRKICDKKVTRVPLPLVMGECSGLQRRHFGLSDDNFVFFCAFDFNSSVARKNPQAVIEAFRHAFPQGDERATLLIKSSNGYRHAGQLMKLLALAGADKRIVVRDDLLERPDLQALHRCIDVHVSLHRCEGFGLGMAEAMSLGKPVVATGYSGNMEFMTAQNSCLVDYQMVALKPDDYPYGAGQYWADPNPRHAAEHMRSLFDDREFACRLGARARDDMARNFSVDACMNVLARHLPPAVQSHQSVPTAGFDPLLSGQVP